MNGDNYYEVLTLLSAFQMMLPISNVISFFIPVEKSRIQHGHGGINALSRK